MLLGNKKKIVDITSTEPIEKSESLSQNKEATEENEKTNSTPKPVSAADQDKSEKIVFYSEMDIRLIYFQRM